MYKKFEKKSYKKIFRNFIAKLNINFIKKNKKLIHILPKLNNNIIIKRFIILLIIITNN